jgi:ABC-2 type transport system ATP-binding protein
MAMIELKDITKSYDEAEKPAVNHLSLSINKNETFGLLGPNGAGKTTTISMLCGLVQPTSGSISIKGLDLKLHMNDVKQFIGVVPQDIALYPTLTGKENLEFYGAMYGVPKVLLNNRIASWLKKFEMEKAANKSVSSYSGGMKRRINLIAGILHQPEILFLDEPTVGVDVQSRSDIMHHLKELNAEGMTIIYTSHHMEEAEHFCSDVAIINNGEIITRGNPIELIENQSDCRNLEEVFLKLTKPNFQVK